VTGQAAWFDLKVRIEKAEAGDAKTQPQFDPLEPVPGLKPRPAILRFGEQFLPAGSWRRKSS
jgi:hypothetical protein